MLLFQLCLQLFQLYPELRHQGWFQLHQLVSKDAVITGSDGPKAPLASIVSGILGVLTQKVCIIYKRFYEGNVYMLNLLVVSLFFTFSFLIDLIMEVRSYVLFSLFFLTYDWCPLTFCG